MQMSRFWFFSPRCPSDRVQHRLPYTLKPLDFEGSTIISEQFQEVKHQFVSPDMLLKWLIGKTNGHEESRYNFELFQVFFLWIEVHVILKEVCLLWQTRKPPSSSNFQVKVRLKILLPEKKLFIFIAAWLQTDKCFFQKFSMVNNLLQTERFINKTCKIQNDDMYWNGYVLFSSSSSSSSLYNHRILSIKMLLQGAV